MLAKQRAWATKARYSSLRCAIKYAGDPEWRTKETAQIRGKFPKHVWAWYAASRAKGRAARLGVPYDLTSDYLVSIAPDVCPVLGIALTYPSGSTKTGHPSNPSLDRFDPLKGYVVGNVNVISWKANRIKADASLGEVEAVAKWMRTHLA